MSVSRRPVIAIDGPAGAGKSTVARIVADRLQLLYIDSGAMYRALTWKAILKEVSPDDQEGLERLAEDTKIQLINDPEADNRVFCDHQDVTSEIRGPEVSKQVSQVAKVPGVRKQMLRLQRGLGLQGGIVMDGRDIGSEVFPDADFKFFLTASPDKRVERRQLEQIEKGFQYNLEELKREMLERDQTDMQREMGPLVKVPDAIEIDTTDMTLDQVVRRVLEIVNGGEK
ncbi:MAG: (d)CMP kinase [Firmicutes bacterium]|nr:(d)CMP kinase [Bacillota bacterium]